MWVPVLVGSSAAVVTLGGIAKWLQIALKATRTLLGTIATVRELALLMHAHINHHKATDPKHETDLKEVLARLDRLDVEVRDLYNMFPHLRRHVPEQQPQLD